MLQCREDHTPFECCYLGGTQIDPAHSSSNFAQDPTDVTTLGQNSCTAAAFSGDSGASMICNHMCATCMSCHLATKHRQEANAYEMLARCLVRSHVGEVAFIVGLPYICYTIATLDTRPCPLSFQMACILHNSPRGLPAPENVHKKDVETTANHVSRDSMTCPPPHPPPTSEASNSRFAAAFHGHYNFSVYATTCQHTNAKTVFKALVVQYIAIEIYGGISQRSASFRSVPRSVPRSAPFGFPRRVPFRSVARSVRTFARGPYFAPVLLEIETRS